MKTRLKSFYKGQGIYEYYGNADNFSDLPLKGIDTGSIFYAIDTGDIYMFIENYNKKKNGEWKIVQL